jgi:translation elongation factor EF-Tu-like GTPase
MIFLALLLSGILASWACTEKPSTVVLVVNGRDGPTPVFRESLARAKKEGMTAVVVKIENISKIDDKELIDLIELEINELLKKYEFTQEQTSIVKCPLACPP